MTDTADLVKSPTLIQRLETCARRRAEQFGCDITMTAEWQAIEKLGDMEDALSSTQARADKLEAELAEAKRERDAYKSSRWHWKQTAVRFAERSNERLARAESAESSLAAANERVAAAERRAAAYREALEEIAGNCISPGTVASRVLAKE